MWAVWMRPSQGLQKKGISPSLVHHGPCHTHPLTYAAAEPARPTATWPAGPPPAEGRGAVGVLLGTPRPSPSARLRPAPSMRCVKAAGTHQAHSCRGHPALLRAAPPPTCASRAPCLAAASPANLACVCCSASIWRWVGSHKGDGWVLGGLLGARHSTSAPGPACSRRS